MKNKDLSKYIPEYPKGCSVELLAVKAGYVKSKNSEKALEKGVLKLKEDLAWVTVKDLTIVERLLPVQNSTLRALKEAGAPEITKQETVYISKRSSLA